MTNLIHFKWGSVWIVTPKKKTWQVLVSLIYILAAWRIALIAQLYHIVPYINLKKLHRADKFITCFLPVLLAEPHFNVKWSEYIYLFILRKTIVKYTKIYEFYQLIHPLLGSLYDCDLHLRLSTWLVRCVLPLLPRLLSQSDAILPLHRLVYRMIGISPEVSF